MSDAKALLVPHSQGNLYANSAYALLTQGTAAVPAKSLAIVGVATPAAFVAGANGRYVTTPGPRDLRTAQTAGPGQRAAGQRHAASDPRRPAGSQLPDRLPAARHERANEVVERYRAGVRCAPNGFTPLGRRSRRGTDLESTDTRSVGSVYGSGGIDVVGGSRVSPERQNDPPQDHPCGTIGPLRARRIHRTARYAAGVEIWRNFKITADRFDPSPRGGWLAWAVRSADRRSMEFSFREIAPDETSWLRCIDRKVWPRSQTGAVVGWATLVGQCNK